MIYFTSDTHYYHNNVIKYCSRPYQSVEEMDEALIKNWNDVVRPEDTVYVLGDFSLSFRAVELISSRLMGNKILIPGNHDFCHTYNKKSRNPAGWAKWIGKYEEFGWKVLPEIETIEFSGIGIFKLCHHPYTEDNSGEAERLNQYHDKYKNWRPIDDGRILLCGHVHEKWKTKITPKGTLMINVGVDVWDYKPVSLDDIIKVLPHESI